MAVGEGEVLDVGESAGAGGRLEGDLEGPEAPTDETGESGPTSPESSGHGTESDPEHTKPDRVLDDLSDAELRDNRVAIDLSNLPE